MYLDGQISLPGSIHCHSSLPLFPSPPQTSLLSWLSALEKVVNLEIPSPVMLSPTASLSDVDERRSRSQSTRETSDSPVGEEKSSLEKSIWWEVNHFSNFTVYNSTAFVCIVHCCCISLNACLCMYRIYYWYCYFVLLCLFIECIRFCIHKAFSLKMKGWLAYWALRGNVSCPHSWRLWYIHRFSMLSLHHYLIPTTVKIFPTHWS